MHQLIFQFDEFNTKKRYFILSSDVAYRQGRRSFRYDFVQKFCEKCVNPIHNVEVH